MLTAKARLGLHRTRAVDLDQVPHGRRDAREYRRDGQISDRAITLIKDERNSIPIKVPPTGSVLYLSVLDYPAQLAHGRAESHVDAGAA